MNIPAQLKDSPEETHAAGVSHQRRTPVWWQSLQQIYQQLARIINGGVSFGQSRYGIDVASIAQPGKNMDGTWVDANFTVANADLTVTHNLGRAFTGYIPMAQNAAGSIYVSPTYNPALVAAQTQVILRASAILTARIFVF